VVSSLVAASGAGLVEVLLTFGSQSRNAQMAYNKAFVDHTSLNDNSRRTIPVNRATQIWGVGAGALVLRNTVTLASVRSLSPLLLQSTPDGYLSPQAKPVLCDATAAVLTCLVSSPVHQTFNFLVTTPEAKHLPAKQRRTLIVRYLSQQYFVPKPRPKRLVMDMDLSKAPPMQEYSWRLSRIALRDFGMRAFYITALFTTFMSIERLFCAWFRSPETAQEVRAPSAAPSAMGEEQ